MDWLLFNMILKPSSSLLMGKLHIMDGATLIASYTATSGLSGYQEKKHQSWRGIGAMPGCEKIGISSYSVLTEPYSRTSNGEDTEAFFHVNRPFRILVDGIWRAGFGIYFDNSISGLDSCIALRDKTEWNSFRAFMKNHADKGFSSIALTVDYSVSPDTSLRVETRVTVGTD